MKKAVALLLTCIALSACSKDDGSRNDSVSQEQWLSVADDGSREADALRAPDIFLVEPTKSVDQVASYEESQSVIGLLSRLSANDFTNATAYAPDAPEPVPDDQVVLLFRSETGNTRIYGYNGTEYGSRGIIADFNGEYSYFDLLWPADRGGMEFREQDFDHDGMVETAFCFRGAAGTGVEIYRLVMFDDVEKSGMLTAYEFTPEMQLEQFEDRLQLVLDPETRKLNISKDGVTETMIDWERFGDVSEGDFFGIDCLNQIRYDVDEDGIKMRVGIGILLDQGGPTIFFGAEEGGELCLDIMYSDGVYEIY